MSCLCIRTLLARDLNLFALTSLKNMFCAFIKKCMIFQLSAILYVLRRMLIYCSRCCVLNVAMLTSVG